jgi:ubiquinone/menaquinone biosynthesis C-methylase UbiE
MSEPVDNGPQAGTTPYIPALGFHWLTPLYDPLLRWAFPETLLKERVVAQMTAALGADGGSALGNHVLDLGCGTGTLTLLMAQAGLRATGLDIDTAVLALAHRKAQVAGIQQVRFVQGSATVLPFSDGVFDGVATSLVLHHLTSKGKLEALTACARVLRPGGVLVLADFAAPQSAYARAIAPALQRLEEAADNVQGRLPALMAEAGLAQVQAVAHLSSLLGTLSVFSARRLEQTG